MLNTNKPNHINLDYLRTISEGNKTFEKSMLDLFLKLTPKELAKMRTGLEGSDYSALQNGAHKLVSSVGLIGAESMKENLLEIELLALTKTDLKRISVLLQYIDDEHEKVAIELKQILNEIS